MGKNKKLFDKSGIRTHAPFETRKLLLVVELRYTLTWRLGPTRPSYQLGWKADENETYKTSLTGPGLGTYKMDDGTEDVLFLGRSRFRRLWQTLPVDDDAQRFSIPIV